MRTHLLLLSLTLAIQGMAQFNTIAPAGSRLNTKTPKEQAALPIPSVSPNDSIKIDEREESPRLQISPPLKGKIHISSHFGTRRNPFGKNTTEHHSGIDLRAKAGTPIYAMLPGTVEAIGYDSRSGTYIKLRHGNFTVSYCHLIKKPTIPIGTKVNAGSAVAFVGSTGRSTGPHLHITLKHRSKAVDPLLLLNFTIQT